MRLRLVMRRNAPSPGSARRVPDAERGSALIAALVLVSMALLVTSMVTLRATMDAQRIVRAERQVGALNAAEAGLAEALQRMRFDPWLSEASGKTGRATWSVEVSHQLTGVDSHVATLTAVATIADQSRRLRMRVEIWTSLSADQPATLRLVDWRLMP